MPLARPKAAIILVHGGADDNRSLPYADGLKLARDLIAHNYAVLAVDLRNYGESDAAPEGVTFGEAESNDVTGAMNYLAQRNPALRYGALGFSMGGAGAWHIGAHYSDHWVAVSPGAGFVDTARYQNITPDKYPEWYVQKLWGLYDVPDYVRNLFNTNVIAYSGELDPQRQAAVLMEEAFKSEALTAAGTSIATNRLDENR